MRREERSNLSDSKIFQPKGNQTVKTKKKKHTVLPINSYYQRSDWKTWLSERSSEALTSKFWNKTKYMLVKLTKMKRNWIIFPPFGFIKNLWQIHLRDSHGKSPEKKWSRQYHVSEIARLDWPKTAKQFSLVFLSQNFGYFPAF